MPTKAPDPNELKYLNATKHFAKRFGWWWREEPAKVFRAQFPGKGADHSAFIDRLFAAEFEEGARQYEIERRLQPTGQTSFPQLSLDEMQRALRRLTTDTLGPEICETTPQVAAEITPEPGWTRCLIATFNLRHSDKTLIRRFTEFLQQERKRLRMHRAPRSNEGRRNRDVSWRALEMFDLKEHFDAHPKATCPVDIDHSRISKMRRAMKV